MLFRVLKYGYRLPLFFLLLTAGCEFFSSEPLRFLRDQVKAYNTLADVLHRVNDADSARDAVAIIKLEGGKLVDLLGATSDMMRKYKTAKARKSTVEAIQKDMLSAAQRFKAEIERIDQLRGLPAEFWQAMFSLSTEIAIVGMDEMRATGLYAVDENTYDFMKHARDLFLQYGYEKLVQIRFSDLSDNLAEEAYGKLKDAAGGAALYHLKGCEYHSVLIAPIDNFQAFAEKLDLGAIVCKDDPRRLLLIQADRMKLGAKARTDAAELQLQEAELLRMQREREEQSRKEMEDMAERHKEQIQKHAGIGQLDPNAPDYYDKLAEMVLSDNSIQSREAMDALLKIEPDDVESPKTRKKIARAFKEAALEKHGGFNREKAIRGLARWGGNFSVPFLLDILEESNSMEKDVVFDVLGDLKDERAAVPVAARLKDWFDHDKARKCLKRMGPAAEDAVIAVAPSPDPKICLAAIEILGEIGGKKSIKFLRSAVSQTRNPEVRAAIKNILDRGQTKDEK